MITNVKTNEILDAVKYVSNANDKLNTNSILSCICLNVLNDSMIELVATDGNRLHLDRLQLNEAIKFDDLPQKQYNITNLSQVVKILDKKIKYTFFEFVNNEVYIFQDNNNKIKLVQYDGTFPKYQDIIPNYNDYSIANDKIQYNNNDDTFKISFNKNYLQNILKNMSNDSKTNQVTFSIKTHAGTSLSGVTINNKATTSHLQVCLLLPMRTD